MHRTTLPPEGHRPYPGRDIDPRAAPFTVPARTLVVTGGSDPLYEETATALVAVGAHHLTLEGSGHRVQDHPQCTRVVREHWTS